MTVVKAFLSRVKRVVPSPLKRAVRKVISSRQAPASEQCPIEEPVSLDRYVVARTYIRGDGIEIGALHNPLKVPPAARVRYVDRMANADLRRHYPELEALPLVDVDIVADGELLNRIPDGSQDFVIANHFLEHCQNPINAITNQFRVLKAGGIAYFAIPDKRFTFDRHRPVTPLSHLVRDYEEGPEWSRLLHFEEFVRLVDKPEFERQGINFGEDEIKRELEDKIRRDYSIHFHVWTQKEFLELLLSLKNKIGFDIELVLKNGHELIVVLQKLGAETGATASSA